MKPIAPVAEAAYLAAGGVHCPFCHSAQIEGDSFEAEAGTVWQDVRCLDCGEEWQDLYTLTGIERQP
jgi:hypothetical protein